jgi:hypothetical protein
MRRSHDCPEEHREPGQDRERDREALAYARRLGRRKCTNWCSHSWRRLLRSCACRVPCAPSADGQAQVAAASVHATSRRDAHPAP